MITDNLFEKILVEPTKNGANKLYIVSGYASPAIVYRHLKDTHGFSVELLIGMANSEGIRLGSHKTFMKLAKEEFPGRFSCKYALDNRPIHSKIYGWFRNTDPNKGFIGSANYSQMAFSSKQIEAMIECSADPIKHVFDKLVTNSVDCLDPNVSNKIEFFDERKILTKKVHVNGEVEFVETPIDTKTGTNKYRDSITVSLLTSQGDVGYHSGINWGQRGTRNRNEAYIPVTASIRRSKFFPENGQPFMVLTDDGITLDCVIAQQGDKAIETYKDNSILGAYIRKRIGVASGANVDLSDFMNYGRSDAVFSIIDDETYYMDFSV
jgi:hypothetical protein